MTDAALAPYLTPAQATLLRFEGDLPPALRAELAGRLRAELVALRTLVPEPLARDPAGFAARAGRFWEGSLLCADLSGFTALTEELSLNGLLGIEELSTSINRVFGALLEELHTYGGAVVKFGGDALTCFFDAAELGPGHSAAACAAALAMQRRMGAFASLRACGRTHRLRLRVGVHRGRPFGAILGDPDGRELVLAGRAVNRVAALQEQAAPGEVVVSPEVLAALPGVRGAARGSGFQLLELSPVARAPRPPLPPLPAGDELATLRALAAGIGALRPFLPAVLPRHMLVPDAGAGGEFRPVSALFVNVTSLGGVMALLEEAERPAQAILNAYYGQVQRVVRLHGGQINKFDLNSVGDKLLVVFGAPVAHEDDPIRAVAAALDLGPALEQANQQLRQILEAELGGGAGALWRTVDLSLRQRAGVATGNVFAGAVGSPRRREYTVIGQVVNLAARLMAAAEPGAVLVAPATARAVGGAVALEPPRPLALKGFRTPVAAAAVLRRRDEPAAPDRPVAPLVDRARELGLLHEQAGQALAGSGRVVAVTGEPGIGKSRLVGAFWDELADGPARRLTLTPRAQARHTPYSVVRDLLTKLFGLPAEATPEALWGVIDGVVATTAPVFAALAPLLEAVFTVGRPAETAGRPFPLARLSQTEQRERLHDLIIALVAGALQRQPLALLIDDLHWADASSLEVVQRLAQLADTLPLLLVLSYRPGMLPAAPWLALPHATALRLAGLDREASLALLDHLLGGVPAEALEPVLERAQGSPLFLEALVRHLVDRGSVRRGEDGRWELLEPLTDARVPETIEPILAAQLDRLDEAPRELAQVAAVIGTSVSYQVLAAVFSQARQPALHLVDLVRAGILVADEHETAATFRFRQALLRDVAYQSILYAQRRDLHRRVAEQIEGVFAAQVERFAAELAYHYAQAEEYGRACAYALRAARFSRRQNALDEALAGYDQAWGLIEQHLGGLAHGEAAEVLEERADVEALAGRYEEAHRHYRRLLAAGDDGQHGRGLRSAVLCRKLGGVCEQQSLFDEALGWLHRARLLVEQAPPALPAAGAAALELSRVCGLTGWVYFRRGELELAQQWLDEALIALDTAAAAGENVLDERARVFNRLGGVAWMLGNLAAARVYVERSLADFSAAGDVLGRADAQNNLGILAEQLGDWEGAIGSYQAALDANEQSGRRREAAMSRLNLGAAHLHLAAAAAALPLLEQATAEMHALGDTLHEVMGLRWLGRALTRLGRFDEAEEALRRSMADAQQAQLALEQLDTYTALGELALARGDQAAARAARGGGDALLRSVEWATLEVGLFLRFAARVEEAAGATGPAAALRSESRQIFVALGVAAPPGAAGEA